MSATDIARLIAEYEQIRVLPRFSQRQCPIMEMQLGDDGAIWFLQYHKARPLRPLTDRLDATDYPVEEGWLKAQAVRGALGRFVTLQTAIWYPDGYRPTHQHRVGADPEDASFDKQHVDFGLTEYLVRRRTASFSATGARDFYCGMADAHHELRSRWHKPAGSMTIGEHGYKGLFASIDMGGVKKKIRDGQMARFAIDTASDGLSGFVRLNPEKDQPAIGAYL
jgi:hypothetical protein